MNRIATSQQELIEAAKKIAQVQGISKISIRSVASACQVSVGCIYNYFPTKEELIIGVIEDFWKKSFSAICWETYQQMPFTDCISGIFAAMSSCIGDFQKDWLEQISLLQTQVKRLGREKEADYLSYVRKVLVNSLIGDSSVRIGCWDNGFTAEQFAEFTFQSMMTGLKQGKGDCGFLIQVIERCLYE